MSRYNTMHSEVDIKNEPFEAYEEHTWTSTSADPFYDFQISSVSSEADVPRSNMNVKLEARTPKKLMGPASKRKELEARMNAAKTVPIPPAKKTPSPEIKSPKKPATKKQPFSSQGYRSHKRKKPKRLNMPQQPVVPQYAVKEAVKAVTDEKVNLKAKKKHSTTKSSVCKVVTQNNVVYYLCRYCTAAFPGSQELVDHIISDHKEYSVCHICAFTKLASQRSALEKHAEMHLRTPSAIRTLQCPYCEIWFDAQNFRRHESSHLRLKRFKCDFCLYKTQRQQSLTNHLKEWHMVFDR